MRPYLRYLRIGWTALCSIVVVLQVVLWVRSYWWIDFVLWTRPNTLISATVFRGQAGSTWSRIPVARRAEAQEFRRHSNRITSGTQVNYNDGTGKPLPSYMGFKSSWLSAPKPTRATTLVIPFWFPTFVMAVIAAVPYWRGMKWRFSLRTLLIATTLVAVGWG